tara:strand:- start:238 stop:2478 length:2241 start_codon:yes stop_codon:yes gene_type:complete
MNKLMLEQVLREELLVMKINKDIMVEHKRLVSERSDWYSLVAEEFMKLEQGEDFDSSVIEEGVWSKIKYYMAKLPNLEKGGKIFGRTKRTKAAAEKLEAAIANATKKTFGDFRKKIKKDYPEFPNMESKEEFMNALLDIGAIYDSVDAVVGKGIDAVSANALVDALREYLSYLLDYELSDTYKHFNEGQEPEEELEEAVGKVASTAAPTRRTPNRTGTAGGGGAPEDPGTPKGKFTKRGAQGDAVDSTALAGLASNKLPAILGVTGAAAVLAGLFAASPQALAALKQLRGLKNVKQVATGMQKIAKTFGPADGEGFTQMVGRLTAGDPGAFGPGTDPNVFFKAVKSLGIDPANPTQFFELGADQGAYTTALKSGAKTLGEMFPASNKDLFLDKGAKATAEIAKSAVKNLGTLGAGGGAAVAAGQLAAASALASTLGIGLVSAGAAVKLIRVKGQKSSRAQLLSDLSKELQPFDVPDSQQAIDPPVDVTPGPDADQQSGEEEGGQEEAGRDEGGSPGEEEKPEEPGEPQVIKVPVLVRFDDDDIKYYRLSNNKLRKPEQRKEADEILTDLEKKTLIGRDALEENVVFMEMFEQVEEEMISEISTDEFENKFGRGSRAKDIRSLKRKNRPRKRGNKRYEPVYYYVFDKSILNDMEAAAPGAKANQFVSRVTRKIIAFLKQKGLQQISPKQAKVLMTRAGGGGTGMKGINHAKAIKILQKYKVVTAGELKESKIIKRWQKIAGISKRVL